MKTRNLTMLAAVAVALAAGGCGDSSTASKTGTETTAAAPTQPAPGQPTLKAATDAVTDLAAQLAKSVQSQTDKTLASLGTELADKMKALGAVTGSDAGLKTQVEGSLQSLMAGKDSNALATLFQVVQSANLTQQQVQLVKEAGNIASAFVVQRNFSSLEGAQGDVATLVNALRKGEITPAVPALQKIAQNAKLTAPQKELMGSLVDRYAPALKQAGGALQQGLQSLPGLKGTGK